MTKKFPALRVLVVEDELLVRWAIAETVTDARTAYDTPEVTKGALELGAYRAMGKPFEMPDLEELLLQAC